MRAFLAALILCLLAPMAEAASWANPVPAAERHHLAAKNYGHERNFAGSRPDSITHRSGIRKAGDGDCSYWIGRGLGCGCTVARLLGIPWNYKGLNLRQARSYFAFPRTSPHVGAVAIWTYPRSHVELVSAVHGGAFDSRGTYNFRNVSVQRVTFVDVR